MKRLHRNEEGPRFFFGKVYRWAISDRGNLTLQRWEDDE